MCVCVCVCVCVLGVRGTEARKGSVPDTWRTTCAIASKVHRTRLVLGTPAAQSCVPACKMSVGDGGGQQAGARLRWRQTAWNKHAELIHFLGRVGL